MAYLSEADLENEIFEELQVELQDEPLYNEDVLALKVKDAVRELKRRRAYQNSTLSESDILADLEYHFPVIKQAALVWYNRMGAEGEGVHYENTVHRSFIDDDYIFTGVIPFVKVLV